MFIAERPRDPTTMATMAATPFPRLPDTLLSKYACGQLALRPFGVSERDLEVGFTGQPRPHLITQLIAACTVGANGERLEPDFFWGLPVGKRIECLLTIAAAGDRTEFVIPLRCPDEACAQASELELSLSEIVSLQNQTDDAERFAVRRGDERLYVRRPTGSDQLDWLDARFADEPTAFGAMVRALVSTDEAGASSVSSVGAEVDGGWIGVIEEALDEFDPLVNFSLSVRCPFCEAEHEHAIDLEELSLRRLRQSQLRLLASVHRLAKHYHWNEREIFAVPHWRRAFYLALIDREEDR
ncbi:MAG TPA: hypothetical protein VJ842_14090 [Pyrinomonadaceae bacterium]|nr:hypothetical protein [Pyrinomonadaceae bacterium]